MNKFQKLQSQISESKILESEIKNESLNKLELSIHNDHQKVSLNDDLKELKKIKDDLHSMDQDVDDLYDTLSTSLKELERSQKRKERHLNFYKPNIEIDEKEKTTLTKGKNIYKLFWIFLFGSFLGYLVETLFTILKNGVYSNHSGLLFGPFNIIYGLAAVLLTHFLYRYRCRNKKKIFMIAILVGTFVEYFSSFLQEMIFGSTSWDYSGFLFNIDGRVCLLYSIFWGLLGIVWIKVFYPILSNALLKFNPKFLKVLTITLALFLLFDISFSAIASYNWLLRKEEKATIHFFDEYYPDEVMEVYYPNLVFKK